ncbi:tetratricopeptide repeat protein [Arthrospiribacter ruber]|uniref:Tetratricopeptide repeat protein n=1 Tax=Arthrospiribacter ruber TaxID=2487934 RepID=A0A951IV25_9BACT|nr:tetratricopeptide repeat protein [Arthrospiribacter ruber]MBW3467670.1 tetratricopeptide repeat protein [Arthrospiribacter ruber]
MKVKSVLAGFLTIMMAGFAQAQEWNWPSDPAEEARARELNAAYTDYMKSEQFVEATRGLNWLLTNVPQVNESIYINGVNVYAGAANASSDAAQKRVYQDSVMTVFELRDKYYDNESRWAENRAYYAYNFWKGEKDKLEEALSYFDRVVEINGNFNTPTLVGAYFDLVYRHSAYNKAFTKMEQLEKYENLKALLDEAEAEGKDVSSPKSTLEQLVVAMELIDCEFIENNLGPKLKAEPENLMLAQQIFKYSVQYKCLNSSSFLMALELIDNDNPTFSTSQVRAMRYMQNREYEKAQPILEKALSLAENDKQKAEVQFDLAKVHAQAGRKSAARSAAMESAKLDSDKASDAYTMVGQLYMGSFNDCKGGESRAKDYSIYIAAYNAFQRAGNNDGMRDARARFPSKEELFTEGLQAGSTISTGCWIGETVTLATRD